jgi:hypothetical protein
MMPSEITSAMSVTPTVVGSPMKRWLTKLKRAATTITRDSAAKNDIQRREPRRRH